MGGLTITQGLEIIRGCRGLNLVGGDVVEVSPAYDTTGNTALVGANMAYEILCVMPGYAMPNAIAKTCGEYLVELLAAYGVDTVFGIPGCIP